MSLGYFTYEYQFASVLHDDKRPLGRPLAFKNLLAKVREVIHEGNVQQVILKSEDGATLVEVPLTAGVAATVLTAAFSPALVAIGAIAALLSRVTLVVERREP